MLCLLDTGILLRLFARSDPNHASVVQAVKLLHRLGHRPVIAIQNAVEFGNVMTRPATVRGGYGLSVAMTRQRLQHIERRCTVLAENLLVFDEWKRLALAHGVSGRAVHDARLVAQTLPGRRLATALIEFAGEQSKCLERGQSFSASTEVLESLIGKGKRLQGQHSRGGFTHMILGMAASVVRITHEAIKPALENIRDIDLRDWCAKNLGPSLTAQRRQALPAIPEILTIPGTEMG